MDTSNNLTVYLISFLQLKESLKRLETKVDEEEKEKVKCIKEKEIEIDVLQSKMKGREALLEKVEADYKSANETIEKEIREKNELKQQTKGTEARLSTNSQDLSEARKAIEVLKAELELTKKELRDKNKVEPTPASNASLNALKSLFEEKEAERDKTKAALEAEKKRTSELVVTIKVLGEIGGLPSTPSPSPFPSPSLSIPPNPPPLQLAHPTARSQNTQSQITSSVNSNLSSSAKVGHTHASVAQKRTSPTPPPLTMAPKVQRVIHVSEGSSLESIAKDNRPSITSTEKKADDIQSNTDNPAASSKTVSRGVVNPTLVAQNKANAPPRNSSKPREDSPTSALPIQNRQLSTSHTMPVSSTSNNESDFNGIKPTTNELSNNTARPASQPAEG